MLRYNPVVSKGTYQVSFNGVTRKYKAIDAYEAKWKLSQFMKIGSHLGTNPEWQKLWREATVEILVPTIRQSDLK